MAAGKVVINTGGLVGERGGARPTPYGTSPAFYLAWWVYQADLLLSTNESTFKREIYFNEEPSPEARVLSFVDDTLNRRCWILKKERGEGVVERSKRKELVCERGEEKLTD